MSYRKGSRAERELQSKLYSDGFSVVRVAGSGRSTLPSPDLVAIKAGKAYAIECKATSKDSRSIPKKELGLLKQFCDRGGCVPVVAVKFDRRGWRFYDIDEKFHIKNGRTHLFQTKLQ
jgi:Holliday junction resolvase